MRTAQRSFAAGEIAYELRGQVQAPAYQTGLAECVNCITLPHGPVMFRPGTEFIDASAIGVDDETPAFIPFVASDTEAFVLEVRRDGVTPYAADGTQLTTVPISPALPAGILHRLHWAQSFDVLTLAVPGRNPVQVRRTAPATFAVSDAAPIGQTPPGWPWVASWSHTVATAGTAPRPVPYMMTVTGTVDGEPVERVADRGVLVFDPNDGTLLADLALNPGVTGPWRLYYFIDGAWKRYYVGTIVHTSPRTIEERFMLSDPPIEQDRMPPLAWHRPADFHPRAVGYHQQRKWFGGFPAGEDVMIGLQLGSERESAWSNPALARDAISVELATVAYNQIEHLASMTDMIVLTASAVFIASGGDSTITPTNMAVRPRAAVGAAPVQPAVTEDAVVFSAARGAHMHEVRFSREQGGHVVNDISRLAPHLLEGRTVRAMTMQLAPFPVLWVVRDDGVLLSCTYSPRSQVLAWHRHELPFPVHGVASIPAGIEDSVFLYSRSAPGLIRIFRFGSFLDDSRNALRLDMARVRTGGEPTTTVTGLAYINGQTVAVVADGIRQPDRVVTGGMITLDRPATRVSAGILYEGRAKTLSIVTERGLAAGEGTRRNLREAYLRIRGTVVPKIGPSFDNLVEAPPRHNEDPGDPPASRDELVSVVVPPAWTDEPALCMLFDEPFPAKVLSAAFDIEIGR